MAISSREIPVRSGIIITTGLILLIFFYEEHLDLRKNLASIPTYDSLKRVSGVIENVVVLDKGVHSKSNQWFGALKSDSNDIIEFSCDPADNKLDCVYSRPWTSSPLIGRHATLLYIDWPARSYSGYKSELKDPSSRTPIDIPRQTGKLVMELTVDDTASPDKILSYQSSVDRIYSAFSWLYITENDIIFMAAWAMSSFFLAINYIRDRINNRN